MNLRPALVLVDFDDTLVETAPRFEGARAAFFELLERAGIPRALCESVHHDEVDVEMIRTHGLGPFRLEPSFRETYRRLCERLDRLADLELEEECAALGRAVPGTPPGLDGALDALRRLAAALPTALYTQSGSPEYQMSCIREAGVLDVLPEDRIRICERKTPDEFLAAVRHFGVDDPAAACMVGNSMRSDINPALLAGARAILVEVEQPWHFDLAEPVSSDFVRVRSFAEAVTHLLLQAQEVACW